MTAGTYTVTASSKTDTNKKSEKSVEIENQYVASIQILNDLALTGRGSLVGQNGNDLAAAEAYVYYKVMDQYGEDLTASTSIQWSTSCGTPRRNDRSIGKLTLKRTDDKAFTYGEQIYVTGVYAKTGISVNATLTVGAEQALDSIEMAGFVRKNTNKLLDSLPVGFKSDEYYLVFDALDQNGNILTADNKWPGEATFISDNVLLIREIKNDDKVSNNTTVVIDGYEYNGIIVQPGQYVDRGGEVNITAIATKTGKQTKRNFVVGQNQILTSFSMSSPSDIIADGESVEIPFRALDQNGEEITNFVALADNINQLTFTSSVGNLYLKEEDDGTATLIYKDPLMAWNNSESSDGIDRTISLTSVVVGGGTDSLLLSVSDKARPDAIKDVKVDSVMLEGSKIDLAKNSFTFLDQYGREMLSAVYGSNDNGFFEAAKSGNIQGLDFSGYTYDVSIKYAGSDNALVSSLGGIRAAVHPVSKSALLNVYSKVTPLSAGGIESQKTATFVTGNKIQTAAAGNTFTFAIVKTKNNQEENVSTEFKKNFTVVDISLVRGFMVEDFDKLYVETAKSNDITGDTGKIALSASGAGNLITATLAAVGNPTIKPDYYQDVVVKGTYNGESVTIPVGYYTVEGRKVSATSGAVSLTGSSIQHASAAALTWADFYNAGTANYLRKDASDTIKVSIYSIFSNGRPEVNGSEVLGAALGLSPATISAVGYAQLQGSVNKVITMSDAAPVVTKINAPDTITINPNDTKIQAKSILDKIEKDVNHFGIKIGHGVGGTCTVEDQYGKSLIHDPNLSITYKVSNVTETNGFADNNFTVNQNDSEQTEITGAERGDTFVLTITARDSKKNVIVTKDITITVGADSRATLTTDSSTPSYGDKTGLKATLETQRQNSLGNVKTPGANN